MLQICQNIKQARLSTGMSQGEFAEKIGKKRSTYAEWESNFVPDLEILKKIAEAANTTLAALLNEQIDAELPKELPWQIIDRLSKGIENITRANLLLAEKINSGGSGSAPLSDPEGQKGSGPDPLDVNLSGRKKPIGIKPKKAKPRGILKTVSK